MKWSYFTSFFEFIHVSLKIEKWSKAVLKPLLSDSPKSYLFRYALNDLLHEKAFKLLTLSNKLLLISHGEKEAYLVISTVSLEQFSR